METIYKQEELIFKEYQALLGDNREISPDGLHYLGDFYYTNNCWGRYCGDEEKLWQSFCKLKRGLVILTKDLNDSTAWDIREEHARKNGIEEPTPSMQNAFYRNLRRWIYGLLNMNTDGLIPEYPPTNIAQECFETKPWVRVNLKKVPGGSSIDNGLLDQYVDKFRSPLLRQLVIYKDASIYLDCTRRRGIVLLSELYPDLKPFGEGNDEWIYFSEKHHFIIVNSYHPSYPVSGGEEAYYNRMRNAILSFFQEYPNFL